MMPNHISGAPLDGPADCTLACDEGHLTAHKIVLCAHSKYLQDILSKFPNAEHPIIILTELNITDIKILVNYMYTGDLVITNDGSPTSLLRAAQILKIDSLTDFDDEDEDENENVDNDEEEEEEDNEEDEEEDEDFLSGSHGLTTATLTSTTTAPTTTSTSAAAMRHHLAQADLDLRSNDSISIDLSQKHHHQRQHQHNQLLDNHLIHNEQQDSNNSKDNQNKIRCHLCNIGLSDVKCLYRHVLTRHLPEKWGYKCEFCDREFSRDDHLMRHYTTKHKNMEFNREKIRETRRLNREMAKNFHDHISTI